MITTRIKGGRNEVKVDDKGRLNTHASLVPPVTDITEVRIFRQYFTDDGLPNDGTNEVMLVDGSTTAVEFFVSAADDGDRYIDSVNFLTAGAGAALNEFANAAALTVGCEVKYIDPELGDVIIHDAIKTNFDIIRLCSKGAPAIGATTTAYRANNISGALEGYSATLDFSDQFGIPYGIKIPKGSRLKLSIIIKDNLSGITGEFSAIAYGYDRIL